MKSFLPIFLILRQSRYANASRKATISCLNLVDSANADVPPCLSREGLRVRLKSPPNTIE